MEKGPGGNRAGAVSSILQRGARCRTLAAVRVRRTGSGLSLGGAYEFERRLNDFFVEKGIGWELRDGRITDRGSGAFARSTHEVPRVGRPTHSERNARGLARHLSPPGAGHQRRCSTCHGGTRSNRARGRRSAQSNTGPACALACPAGASRPGRSQTLGLRFRSRPPHPRTAICRSCRSQAYCRGRRCPLRVPAGLEHVTRVAGRGRML